MEKTTKILTGIMIVLIIILIAYTGYIYIDEKTIAENKEKNETNTVNAIENYTTDENTSNSTNSVTENSVTENTAITGTATTPTVVGKEEQESHEQSGTENPDQTAIDFAKEKWGETSSSYNFVVEKVEGNIYHVAVISNTITIAYMDVNLATGEVTER